MIPRNLQEEITKMLALIPAHKEEFIKELKEDYEYAANRDPEDEEHWKKTMGTLYKHMVWPKEEWEYQVLSIFTNGTIEDLKNMHSQPPPGV